MYKKFLSSLGVNVAVMDVVFINAIFFLCKFIFLKHPFGNDEAQYMYFGFFISVTWLATALVIGLYNQSSLFSFERFIKRTTKAFGFFLLIVLLNLFFFRVVILSRAFLVAVLGSFFLVLLFSRFAYFLLYQYFRKKDWLRNKVVIIGYNELSKKLVSYLEEEAINKQVVGFCEEEENVFELSRYPIIGSINNTIELCKNNNVTEIYSTIAPGQNPAIYSLMEQAGQNCIRFKLVPDLRFFINKEVYVDYFKEIPVFNLRNEPLNDLSNRIEKRLFDIFISFCVTVFILSWLIPLIGLLIKLESKGPVFFSQPRSGKDNKPFNCLKFRSMTVNANANILQATKGDKRITRIGKFLRRTSLDEFPQFLNVLKGHMSIVGPRPHMLKHTDEYSQKIDKYMIRHFMKPGITGWAQVNGYRGETNTLQQMQKRVDYDLWYQEHWNLFFDLKILFLTVFNTLKGEENAY